MLTVKQVHMQTSCGTWDVCFSEKKSYWNYSAQYLSLENGRPRLTGVRERDQLPDPAPCGVFPAFIYQALRPTVRMLNDHLQVFDRL